MQMPFLPKQVCQRVLVDELNLSEHAFQCAPGPLRHHKPPASVTQNTDGKSLSGG